MDIQDEGYLGDMEEELEGKEFSEEATKIIQDMAAFYISQDQRNDKGKLLASYKSGRFLKTYINIYERAPQIILLLRDLYNLFDSIFICFILSFFMINLYENKYMSIF